MNALAQRENARMLAAATGIAEDQAAQLLDVDIAVTFDEGDRATADCANHVCAMLRRTIRGVHRNTENRGERMTIEVVIGSVVPRFASRHVFVRIGDESVVVSSRPYSVIGGTTHRVGVLLGACYAAAATLKAVVGEMLPFQMPDVIRLSLPELLGPDLPLLYEPLVFDETYLAGAGAIGNGFIYGLSQFDVAGKLHIADDDTVSGGNLQRCLLFENEHVNASKVDALCAAIEALLPKVIPVPHSVRMQDVPARCAGPWLKRLVVGVDSPRARRSLQSELPGEVFDASTTGISEVVLHFHRQPTEDACLAALVLC